MKLSWKTEWPMLAVLIAMFAAAAYSWDVVPDRLPVHWNAAGQVDGWGGKVSGLLMIPGLALFCYLLMALIPRVDPGGASFAQFAGPYNLFRLVFLLFLAGLYAAMHATFRGIAINMTVVILPLLGVLFVAVGWMMAHVQPNWSVGIRTPWTLSSRRSWDLSHRLGSKLFMAAGLIFVAAGAVGKPWALAVAVGATVLITLITIVYSYLVWKDDPNRVPPGRGGPIV